MILIDLHKFTRQKGLILDGVGAPAGNQNAAKNTPDNNPAMKKKVDDINANIDGSLSRVDAFPEEMQGTLRNNLERKREVALNDIDEEFNPTTEEQGTGTYKSVDDANNKMKEMGIENENGFIGFTKESGNPVDDANTASSITDAIDATYKDYPELQGKVKGFRTGVYEGSNNKYGMASYDLENNVMNYQPKMSQAGLDREMKLNGVPKHYAVENPTVKSQIDHEMGHAVVGQAITRNKNGVHVIHDKDYKNAYDKWQNKAKASGDKDYIKNNLSGYSTVSPHEFFAESWSEYRNSPNPRPMAMDIGKMMERKIKGR